MDQRVRQRWHSHSVQMIIIIYPRLSLSARSGLLLDGGMRLPICMHGEQNKDKEMPLLVSVLIDITTLD